LTTFKVNEHNEEDETACAKGPSSSAVQSPIEDKISEHRKMEQPTVITSEVQQETEKKLEAQYDLMMGYYIVMGGFVMSQSNYISGEDDNKRGSNRILWRKYIKELAENGVFLRVDPKQIEDKSKADILAKFLVCFQVFWMLVEVCRTIISYL
jgi:hypothetical protein